MKVFVEFDLTNRIHHDLYLKVKSVMLAHDNVDVKMPTPSSERPTVDVDELQAAYVAAAKANSDVTKKQFAEFRGDFGDALSNWTPDQKWLAYQTFKKLADTVADKF